MVFNESKLERHVFAHKRIQLIAIYEMLKRRQNLFIS
jgi:hypothetical protein